MLSPSDFNNAVPQFTNGNYASNPLNPQYIAEPSSTDYNRGVEPIQTLPAQWWNWFMNKFTTRFNKVNVYVKNIFNELSQLLSLVSESPSGTEGDPTIGQLKDMFETKYPDYLKTTPALSNTYVPQTTKVNGQALSGDVTVSCVACASCNGSGTAFGTASTLNTGTAAGCIPIVGTALGTTNGQFVATDANGKLKPSGYTASCFRASTWTPTCVACAGADGAGCAFGTAARCAATAFRASTWTPSCVACAGKDGSGCAFGTAARCAATAFAKAYNNNTACVQYACCASCAGSAGTASASCCTKSLMRSFMYSGCGSHCECGVCICLASVSTYELFICHNRVAPIIYFASHFAGSAYSRETYILPPGIKCSLGCCWNMCRTDQKCIQVFLLD